MTIIRYVISPPSLPTKPPRVPTKPPQEHTQFAQQSFSQSYWLKSSKKKLTETSAKGAPGPRSKWLISRHRTPRQPPPGPLTQNPHLVGNNHSRFCVSQSRLFAPIGYHDNHSNGVWTSLLHVHSFVQTQISLDLQD